MVRVKRKREKSREEGNNDTLELSELEKRRIENISRNSEYLKDLGLNVTKTPKNTSTKTVRQVQKLRVPADEPEVRRRSSRLASIPSTNFAEQTITVVKHEYSSNSKSVVESDLQVGVFKGLQKDERLVVVDSSASSSAASVVADIDTMLSLYLGKPLIDYGKAAVIKTSNHNRDVRFNKYSGIAEWKNCLYLWVNLGGETGYVNSFTEGGRFMMWYGGSKMHSESRVVQRLINPANFPDNTTNTNDLSNNDLIILFVRKEGEGYACLGRCQIVAADLQASPIQVKWTLKDFDKLVNIPYFREIIAHN